MKRSNQHKIHFKVQNHCFRDEKHFIGLGILLSNLSITKSKHSNFKSILYVESENIGHKNGHIYKIYLFLYPGGIVLFYGWSDTVDATCTVPGAI